MEEVEEATFLTIHSILASIYKKNGLFVVTTSITNFKFLACVKHVEGKLCFYRIYHIVHSETRQKLFLSARIKLNYHIFAFLWGSGIAGIPTIYLHLIFTILQFEISSLMNWIFFPSLNWIFLPAVACKIPVWNQVHQTWIFKLENCKNRVQINRWSSSHCSSSANWMQIVWNISFYFKILRHSKVSLFCQNYSKLTFTVISWNTYRSSKFPFHCLSRQTVVRNHDGKHFRSSQLYTKQFKYYEQIS